MVRVQQKARGRTTGSAGTTGLPRAMVLRLIRGLPGEPGFLATVVSQSSLRNLAPASRHQNHTTSPYALASFARANCTPTPSRPSHPCPYVRDDRDTPLRWNRMAAVVELIWGGGKEEYFLKEALTGILVICPTRLASPTNQATSPRTSRHAPATHSATPAARPSARPCGSNFSAAT